MSKHSSDTIVIPIDRAASWSPDGLTEVLCPAKTTLAGALPQIRMLPACLAEMLPIVFREPGGNGLKRAWHCLPFEADSSFLVVC